MRLIKGILIQLGGILLLLLVWGMLIEPRLLDIEQEAAAIPHLPRNWEGRQIALLADWQVGMWLANTGTMREATERVVRLRPAAVLLAGDFIYRAGPNATGEIQRVVEILRPLTAAGIPIYAVLGNHDYGLNQRSDPLDRRMAAQVASALEGIGIRVLTNRVATLADPAGGPPLYVAGIGSTWAGDADPVRAVASVPAGAPRIVFMHNPHAFPRLPAGAAPLAIAGHTHGGQIRLPGRPHWSWISMVRDEHVVADGWISAAYGQPGNRLYVNRGLGFSTVPIRINCRPELTVFTLRRRG
jgi:predicted MPP superfamily phosphohydrolase